MATLPSDATPKTNGQESSAADDTAKKRNAKLRASITVCKKHRKKLIDNWSVNVDYRRGKAFGSESDEDRIAVPMDWHLTKRKHSNLFSQVPKVYVSHPPQTVSKEMDGWLFKYEQKLNDTMKEAGLETAMDEIMPDCINAAGIGVIMVSEESITENVEVPAMDLSMFPPELQDQILQSKQMPDGSPLEMVSVPRIADKRYKISRVSPSDFIWDTSFTGADFDNCPIVGRSGRISWYEAKQRWDIPEESKKDYLGSGSQTYTDTINRDLDVTDDINEDMVSFDEIFYKEHQFIDDIKRFKQIHHVVFLGDKQEPVVDETWKGQQIGPDGQIVGCQKYPLRVLTLTYVTDDAIPPADTAVIRPQVDELNKSRTQMMLQREHSLPMRWANVNLVDPAVMGSLMRGTWQNIIPVESNGDHAFGEIARSNFPNENMAFDSRIKSDIVDTFAIGQGQSGSGVETKAEAMILSDDARAVITRERAKVTKFIIGIAEAIGGLLCIYEDPTYFGEGFDPGISRILAFSVLADSTVLLDSNQRLKRIEEFINRAAKSGWVNLEPVLREYAQLSGLDPSAVIRPPQPASPVEPNISLRLTGTEDLLQPLTLAFLMKSGQAPSTELIEQAKALIQAAVAPPAPPAPPPGMPDMSGDPSLGGPPQAGAMSPGVMPPPPLPGGMPAMPPLPAGMPSIIPPTPPPPMVGNANPNFSAMPLVNKRTLDR